MNRIKIGRGPNGVRTRYVPIDDYTTAQELKYLLGQTPPRYPLPAVCNHLYLIAGDPMQAWEDFKAIGWHGKVCRTYQF